MGNPGSTRSSLKARLPIALALIALLGLLASLAEARVDYPEAKIIEDAGLTGVADQPQVGVDGAGNATVVWRGTANSVTPVILARRHRANGQLQPSLSQPAHRLSNTSITSQPQVAVDRAGTATVVWQAGGGVAVENANFAVEARQINPDGVPASNALPLAGDGPTVHAFDPQVAVNSDGNPTVVWWEVEAEEDVGGFVDCIEEEDEEGEPVNDPADCLGDHVLEPSRVTFAIKSVRLGDDGKPQEVQTIDQGEGTGVFVDQPDVAVHEDGGATVVWRHLSADDALGEGVHFTIRSRQLNPDGELGDDESAPIEDVSGSHSQVGGQGQIVGNPQVATDGQGRATVVFERTRTQQSSQTVESRRLGADGEPETTTHVLSNRTGELAFDPQVAVDSPGNATVVWYAQALQGTFRVQARRIQAGGSLGTRRDLSAADHVGLDPQVAVDGEGRATVVWQSLDPETFDADGSTMAFSIQTVRFNPQGQPGDRKTLPASGQPQTLSQVDLPIARVESPATPQVAVHSQGEPEVVWASASSSPGTQGLLQPLKFTIQTARGDIIAPDAQITSGPSGTIGTATPTFTFSSDPLGATFECQVAGRAPEACTSPYTVQALPNGTHTFRVHAVDNEGDAGIPASRTFTVNTTPPAPAQAPQAPPPPRTAEPPPRIELPPLTFEFLRVRRNAKRGIARLVIEVPGPGLVVLRRNKRVRPFARQAEEAGRVALRVRPRGKARRQLMRKVRELRRSGSKGRARTRVRARVTFRPEVGDPVTQATRVRIVRRVG